LSDCITDNDLSTGLEGEDDDEVADHGEDDQDWPRRVILD
jgi:hypothetical protein